MSETSEEPARRSEPDDANLRLIDELQAQAARLEEQAAELEAFNDELSASEARLKGVIDSALDAIVTTDAESRVIDWNVHAETMFGWSAEEAIGQRIDDLIIPEPHREAHRRGVERYLETGEPRIIGRRIEITALRRSGEEFPVELTVSATRWGSQVVFTSFIRDLSERHAAERRRTARAEITKILADSETRTDAVPRILESLCLSLSCEAAIHWEITEDEDGAETVSAAESWCRPSGPATGLCAKAEAIRPRRGEGLVGRVWEEGMPRWGDPAEDELTAGDDRPAGIGGALAFPIRLGDRTLGVVQLLFEHDRPPDPRLLSLTEAIGSDLGQFLSRRRAEERLEAANRWQRFLARAGVALAAAAPNYQETLEALAGLVVPTIADWCSIYAVDRSGTIHQVAIARPATPAADRAHGIALEGDRPSRRHPVVQVIETGEPFLVSDGVDEALQSIARNADELERLRGIGIQSGMIVPLVARGRALGAIVLISNDPRRRFGEPELESAMEFAGRAAMYLDNARLYRDAQAANQTKADFLATMSHELRTPLNAVLGYTDLLLQGIPEPLTEPVAEYIERVSFSAKHLLQLIEEILTYSRLEAGRERISVEPVDMAAVGEEVAAVMEPLARSKSIDLVFDLDVGRRISTDTRKVRQILLNLVSNALKFTDEGEVRVTARLEEEDLVLTVRDTGIGIAAEHLNRIFEPFWQVEQSTTRTAHGTGLGLSVTKRFAKLLGGSIHAQSELGRGSCFEVRIPADLSERRERERRASERRER